MVRLFPHYEAHMAIPAPQIRVKPVVEMDLRAREGRGEPAQLEGHFWVSSQDVPEALVAGPNLVSMLIGEPPHVGLHRQIPFRKVYRETA